LLVWIYVDSGGREAGRSPDFPNREAAEAWLTGSWEELHDQGVEEVILHDREAGEPVYRMGLGEERA